MKRKELIRMFEHNGWWLKRNGSNHDIYTNGTQADEVPRHTEIKETLAKKIIKRCGLK